MKRGRIALSGAVIVVLALIVLGVARGDDDAPPAVPAAVLSVAVTRAERALLPVRIPATGNVAAWQEATIGAEGDGLRLTEVRVNVGDLVRHGQVLALFNAAIVEAELAEARAAVNQAEAEAFEAETNATRARALDGSGAMSAQQVNQYVVAAMTARARLDAVRAVEARHRLRLAQTRVLAPGDGVITARAATVGAVVPAGQELFRLIKDGRLEWRAAVAMADMPRLAPGQLAVVTVQGHPPMNGRLRMLAPAIDADTHDGLVYIDLPRDATVRAGAFARGHVEIGDTAALTLPQSAVLLRDGFTYVMRVGPQSNVIMDKVKVGRRIGDRIEITGGLAESEPVIASGLGFLSEGDTVRIVERNASHTRLPAASNPAPANVRARARSGA